MTDHPKKVKCLAQFCEHHEPGDTCCKVELTMSEYGLCSDYEFSKDKIWKDGEK